MTGITDKEVRELIVMAGREQKAIAKADGTVPGLTLTASKGGTASWVVRFRINGKQKEATIGRYPALSPSGARAKARDLRLAIDRGVDVAAEKQARKTEAQIDARAKALNNAMRLQIVNWLSTWWDVASDGDRTELFQHWQRTAANLPGASKWPG